MLELSYQFQTLHDDSCSSWQDLYSVATLQLLPECPYVHFKHVDFKFLMTNFYEIKLSDWSDFLNTDSYYNKVKCYQRSISVFKS